MKTSYLDPLSVAEHVFSLSAGSLLDRWHLFEALREAKVYSDFSVQLAFEIGRSPSIDLELKTTCVFFLLSQGEVDKAEQILNPCVQDDSAIIKLRAHHLCHRGEFQEAEKLLKSLPHSPDREYELGWHSVYHGEVVEGFARIDSQRNFRTLGAYKMFKNIIWDRRPLNPDTKVLVVCEGGIGDTILTLSLAKHLILGQVFFAVPQGFLNVAENFAGVQNLVAIEKVPSNPGMVVIPGFEFSKFVTNNNFFAVGKVLKSKPEVSAFWKSRLNLLRKRFKKLIGLRFSGDKTALNERQRRFSDDFIRELCPLEPETGFVLLYAAHETVPDFDIENLLGLNHWVGDWSDTLGLIENLDGVISSCTGTAHLSAASGARTLVLSPPWPYFSWAQKGRSSYWYGQHVEVLRCHYPNQWQPLLPSVKSWLKSSIDP